MVDVGWMRFLDILGWRDILGNLVVLVTFSWN